MSQDAVTFESDVRPRHSWLKLPAVLLFVLAIGYYLAVIPVDMQRFTDSREVVYSSAAVSSFISLSAHTAYLLVLRYLALLFFLLVALLCLIHVGLVEGKCSRMGLHASLMLVLFPVIYSLGISDAGLPYPRPWDRILEALGSLFGILAILLLLLFYFLFPDGRFNPRWLSWPSAFFVAALVVFFTLLASGMISDDWGWVGGMAILVLALGIGISSQIYRYWRVLDPGQRKQARWVIVSLALFPVLGAAGGTPGSSLGVLISLHVRTLAAALIPLSLAAAILRQGLWDAKLSPRQKVVYWGLGGALTIAVITGVIGLNRPNLGQGSAAVEFEPLPVSAQPAPVVIDTDMAADDWMAILFLLQRPDIEVKAITVTGTGEAHCEPGVRNALGLVALAGSDPIPVACGRETPLSGSQEFPQEWRGGVDSLFGLQLPQGTNPDTTGDAADLLASTIESAGEKVILLTLGPLTNVAEAIQRRPAFLGSLEQVYIMGGALQVPGNVYYSGVGIDNKDAEWNIFVDPLAAKIVVESGAPVTLVPLDATNQVPMDLAFYRLLERNRSTPEANFVYRVLTTNLGMVLSSSYFFWDPLAAALAVDESLGTIKEGRVLVIAEQGPHSGATRLVAAGALARYAKTADAERFVEEFLRTLNQE